MQNASHAGQCLLWATVVCLSVWLPPCYLPDENVFYCVWLASFTSASGVKEAGVKGWASIESNDSSNCECEVTIFQSNKHLRCSASGGFKAVKIWLNRCRVWMYSSQAGFKPVPSCPVTRRFIQLASIYNEPVQNFTFFPSLPLSFSFVWSARLCHAVFRCLFGCNNRSVSAHSALHLIT